MKRWKKIMLALICVAVIAGIAILAALLRKPEWFGIPKQADGPQIDLTQFTLTWEDDFSAGIDYDTRWKDHHSPQNVTTVRKGGYWHRDFAQVKDGNLHISIQYMEDGYGVDESGAPGKPGYYSYGMDTQDLFAQQYGYFEVRCKLPKGHGLWSAFWMMNDAMYEDQESGLPGAEVDIYESPYYSLGGLWRNSVSSAVHYGGYGDKLQSKGITHNRVLPNPYENFHTYGLEWNADGYTFYIDGKQSGSSNFGGAAQAPLFLLLSVEVDGAQGQAKNTWSGDIQKYKDFPSEFVVDYVRVYQYK